MKKTLVLSLFLVLAINVTEAKTLNVISGSTKFFTEENEKLDITINWGEAVIRKKSTTMEDYFKAKGEKEYADWQEGVKFSKSSFCKYFNENKTKNITLDATDKSTDKAKYTLSVQITYIDLGYNTGVIFGIKKKSGGMRIYGKAIITNNITGEQMVEYDMVKVKSMGVPSIKGRMIMTCHYLAEGLIKQIK